MELLKGRLGGARSELLRAALVFLAGLAACAPLGRGELFWDDEFFVKDNPFVSDCANLPRALSPANLVKVSPVLMSARPLLSATMIADACAGHGPRGMKFVNAGLHALAAAALFCLLMALTGSGAGSFFGALVFAVHPVAPEVAGIVAFRSHLLGALFFYAGLLAALLFSRRAAPAAAACAAGCYFLALMSVELPVTLPAAAALAVYFDSGRAGLKKLFPLLAAMLLIAGFYAWFRAPRSGYSIAGVSSAGVSGPSLLYPEALFPRGAAPAPPPQHLPWEKVYTSPAANIYTMSGILLDYLGIMTAGLGIEPEYSPRAVTSFGRAAFPLAAVLLIFAAGIALYRKRQLAGLGILLVFLMLLPVMNLIPLRNIKALRYVYLPLAGFALAAAAAYKAAAALKARRAAALAGLWLCALGFAVSAAARKPALSSGVSFFRAAEAGAPGSGQAQVNLSRALLRAGDCPGAVRHARLAAGLDKTGPEFRLPLINALEACGRRGEAAEEAGALRRAFSGDPEMAAIAARLEEPAPAGRLK